jgi:diaminohydroxyphosphoribosylaminopyrimidine deaminase / 5-amino-6-(5-phosphoribosylamino)uracil reductase
MQRIITELLDYAQIPHTVLSNPRVSAILIDKNNEIIAKGVHRGRGTVHAEIDALAQVATDVSECELFVSLEPCNHFGTTPPCTEAIINRGIKRVTIGSLDINPISAGGISRLKSAGVQVRVLGNQVDFYNLNYRWFESIKLARPYVAAKLAITLDGYISSARDNRYQITQVEANTQVHELRSQFDAILIGTNTAMVDNPLLTVRNKQLDYSQAPLRVVMGNRDLPQGLNIFNNDARTTQVKTHNPNVLLDKLKEQGLHTLLIEGGSIIFSSFLEQDLLDEINIFMSSKILGRGLQVIPQLLAIDPKREMRIRKVLAWGPDIQIQIQFPRGI